MNDLKHRFIESREEESDEEFDIDFRRYWAIIWREKWGILGLMAMAFLLANLIAARLIPTYEATATLLIENKQANLVSIEEIYGLDTGQREYLATQHEILNSRSLLEDLIARLDLTQHPTLDPRQDNPAIDWHSWLPFLPQVKPVDLTDDQLRESVLDRVKSALTVQPITGTQLVSISFASPDPDLTHRFVNTMVERYIDAHLESRMALTERATTWLTERLDAMRVDLEVSERNLQNYREQQNLVDISGVQTLPAQEIEQLNRQLVTLRNRVSEARSQLDVVGTSTSGYDPRWEYLPAVIGDSLAKNLKQEENQARRTLSELSQRYGPKHPKRIAAESNLSQANTAFRLQVQKVVSGFRENYQQALADQRELERELDLSKARLQDVARKRYELSQLEREVQTNRQLYDMFFTRFKETNATDFAAAHARFVDKAVKPLSPVKPNKQLIVLLSVLLAGTLGVALAFLRDFLDNTVKSAAEVESRLALPVVGVLPVVTMASRREGASSPIYFNKQELRFGESVRTLRTGIVLSGIDSPVKKIVFTSSVPSEGKTTTVLNVALAFGQIERVVLVDADMRRPSIAEVCGIDAKEAGLSNIIAGTDTLEQCTHQYCGIDVITAGVVPPNPLELLSSKRFSDLLSGLAVAYDRVLIDSAPTQSVSDSMVLSQHADGVVFVVLCDSTPIQLVRDGVHRLLRVNADMLGVVLNQFDPGLTGYGSYGKKYYEHYSSHPLPEERRANPTENARFG